MPERGGARPRCFFFSRSAAPLLFSTESGAVSIERSSTFLLYSKFLFLNLFIIKSLDLLDSQNLQNIISPDFGTGEIAYFCKQFNLSLSTTNSSL